MKQSFFHLNRRPLTKYARFHSSSGTKCISEAPLGAANEKDINDNVNKMPIAQMSGSSSFIWKEFKVDLDIKFKLLILAHDR